MTRKLITTLLCLVLAVALPLAALADTRHTLTLIPGDDLSAVPAIADLCDALSLTLTKGEKSGGAYAFRWRRGYCHRCAGRGQHRPVRAVHAVGGRRVLCQLG